MTILVVVAAIAGCNKDPDSRDSIQKNPQNSQPKNISSKEENRNNEQSTTNALLFIQSRLGNQLIESKSWSIREVNINTQEWTWTEDTTEEPPDFSITHERYSVQANNLVWPVRQSGRTITFECRLSKCFTIRYNHASAHFDGFFDDSEKIATKIANELQIEHTTSRSENTWYFSTPDEAIRVATAMNDALQGLGAQKSTY
ncbi:MAG: hypothetical protein ACOY7P_15580 [Pseudomonadota bacterium]